MLLCLTVLLLIVKIQSANQLVLFSELNSESDETFRDLSVVFRCLTDANETPATSVSLKEEIWSDL